MRVLSSTHPQVIHKYNWNKFMGLFAVKLKPEGGGRTRSFDYIWMLLMKWKRAKKLSSAEIKATLRLKCRWQRIRFQLEWLNFHRGLVSAIDRIIVCYHIRQNIKFKRKKRDSNNVTSAFEWNTQQGCKCIQFPIARQIFYGSVTSHELVDLEKYDWLWHCCKHNHGCV